jgi:hypothetical protein
MADLSSIKVAKYRGLLQKELSKLNRDSRSQLLNTSMNWLLTQINDDPKARGAYLWFQEAYHVSQNNSANGFLQHSIWMTFGNHWESPSFQKAISSIVD